MFSPQTFFDLSSYSHQEIFSGLDYPWKALPELDKYLKSLPLGKISTDIPSGAFIENSEEIFIGEGTIVEPGAFIRGPCYIGKGCSIRHGAYIRGGVLTGDRCVIGHDTEVKNTIFLNDAHAAHLAYIGDTILGNRVNLGAGVKCANLRLDRQEISIFHEGMQISTGLRKFGAIIGDRTQIGCNSVLNPGTIVGKDVFCYACINVHGIVPEKYIVKNSARLVLKPKLSS